MAPLRRFVVLFAILSSLLLPPAVARRAAPVASSKLVEKVCNDKYVGNRGFCLKALSGPKAASAKDFLALADIVLDAAAANGNTTREVIANMLAKPASPAWATALQICAASYESAIKSFEMVKQELLEDPETANYDVGVTRDGVVQCEDALRSGNVEAPRLFMGNRFMENYISIGSVVTSLVSEK